MLKLTNDLLWFHPLAVSSHMHLMKHSKLLLWHLQSSESTFYALIFVHQHQTIYNQETKIQKNTNLKFSFKHRTLWDVLQWTQKTTSQGVLGGPINVGSGGGLYPGVGHINIIKICFEWQDKTYLRSELKLTYCYVKSYYLITFDLKCT